MDINISVIIRFISHPGAQPVEKATPAIVVGNEISGEGITMCRKSHASDEIGVHCGRLPLRQHKSDSKAQQLQENEAFSRQLSGSTESNITAAVTVTNSAVIISSGNADNSQLSSTQNDFFPEKTGALVD